MYLPVLERCNSTSVIRIALYAEHTGHTHTHTHTNWQCANELLLFLWLCCRCCGFSFDSRFGSNAKCSTVSEKCFEFVKNPSTHTHTATCKLERNEYLAKYEYLMTNYFQFEIIISTFFFSFRPIMLTLLQQIVRPRERRPYDATKLHNNVHHVAESAASAKELKVTHLQLNKNEWNDLLCPNLSGQ